MDRKDLYTSALFFLGGIIAGFILFPKTEVETIYKTTTKTERDTIYVTSIDTIYVPKTKIKTEVLRDTILVNYRPQISRFETFFPSAYGNTKVSGEVLGEVLKMTAINDYSIPVVNTTTTETKTETIVQKPKGIYLGAGVSSLLQPSAKISYLDNKYLFSYQIEPMQRVHQISVSKKLF